MIHNRGDSHSGSQTIHAEDGSVISNVTQTIKNIVLGGPDALKSYRDREDLLNAVQRIWIDGVLRESLSTLGRIEMDLEDRPDLIERPWDPILPSVNHSRRILGSSVPLDQVFDQSNGMLLILGEPGAGKTTALLTLTEALIKRAKENPEVRIPVVLHLSFWPGKLPDLDRWLVNELKVRYTLPEDVSWEWLKNGQFTFILDGLNEVAVDHRDACVRAINTFRQEYGSIQFAVGCRAEDYRLLSTRLKFGGAVYLCKPTTQQVNQVFENTGVELQAIARLLKQDADLQELAQTPLMLRILVSAYQDRPMDELSTAETFAARRKILFDAYVQRMFDRQIRTSIFSPAATLNILHWLASQMRSRNGAIFYIESLERNWLPT